MSECKHKSIVYGSGFINSYYEDGFVKWEEIPMCVDCKLPEKYFIIFNESFLKLLLFNQI